MNMIWTWLQHNHPYIKFETCKHHVKPLVDQLITQRPSMHLVCHSQSHHFGHPTIFLNLWKTAPILWFPMALVHHLLEEVLLSSQSQIGLLQHWELLPPVGMYVEPFHVASRLWSIPWDPSLGEVSWHPANHLNHVPIHRHSVVHIVGPSKAIRLPIMPQKRCELGSTFTRMVCSLVDTLAIHGAHLAIDASQLMIIIRSFRSKFQDNPNGFSCQSRWMHNLAHQLLLLVQWTRFSILIIHHHLIQDSLWRPFSTSAFWLHPQQQSPPAHHWSSWNLKQVQKP